jgi:hypothetical protein
MRIWTTTATGGEHATAVLLSAGALDAAVSRIGREALPCS